MLLRITDGTETATLSGGTGTFLGAKYSPRPPADERTLVAEDATVILEGTAANVLLDTQKLERLFAIARNAPSLNVRVYVEFQRTGDTRVWRSQIRDGRLMWSDDPIRRMLVTAATSVECAVAWERDPWWECSTAQSLGIKHIFNGDGSGTDPDGEVVATTGADAYNAGEFSPDGVLDAPPHVILTNNDGASASLQRVWFANDVYARFEGGEHLVAGGAYTWSDNATHAVPLVGYLALSADQAAGFVAAGGMRLLSVWTTIPAGIFVKGWLLQKQGAVSTYSEVWKGPEVLTISGQVVYDLGFVQAPPNVQTFDGLYLAFSVYSADADTATLDFVMLCPGRDLLALELSAPLAWADAGTLEWHGDRRYADVNGWHGEVSPAGGLRLRPGHKNRVAVLVEGSSGLDATLALLLQVKYRERRATV